MVTVLDNRKSGWRVREREREKKEEGERLSDD